MVCVIRDREITGELNLDAVAFADRDGRQNIQEFVQDALRGLAETFANTLLDALGPGLREDCAGTRFRNAADCADSKRSTEDFQVMVVDLIAETCALADSSPWTGQGSRNSRPA